MTWEEAVEAFRKHNEGLFAKTWESDSPEVRSVWIARLLTDKRLCLVRPWRDCDNWEALVDPMHLSFDPKDLL